jgi:hypothetical protein
MVETFFCSLLYVFKILIEICAWGFVKPSANIGMFFLLASGLGNIFFGAASGYPLQSFCLVPRQKGFPFLSGLSLPREPTFASPQK